MTFAAGHWCNSVCYRHYMHLALCWSLVRTCLVTAAFFFRVRTNNQVRLLGWKPVQMCPTVCLVACAEVR